MELTFFWGIVGLCSLCILLFAISVAVYLIAKGYKVFGCMILLTLLLFLCCMSTGVLFI